ncbi:MAG: tyrosine-type recombinase/integrase [Lachnospiraceae bacterium]|nr:tyrosine-type recombinase/integrase [Lachnospiraceae bacterium]
MMRISAKDPRLVSLIGEFIKVYLPRVRNRDEDTIASYRYSINLFIDYLGTQKGVSLLTLQASDFNQANVIDFMSWLNTERKNVATTVNHRLSDVRGFCHYLLKKKALTSDEFEEIREINDYDDDRIIEFTWLTTDEVASILNCVDANRDATRDHFLISLLYESGARINEVLSLKPHDIKPTSNGEADVHFYGKGNKHRITPLSKEIWRQYCSYCERYHPEKNELRKKKPDLIHLHSHLFRRTRAMHLYQAKVPLPTISEWLGHSNVETTRFFSFLDIIRNEKVKKTSPSNDI